MILEPNKIKSVAASTSFPSICHEVVVLGTTFHNLSFSNVEFQANVFTLLYYQD